jgi:hypothetical protein
MEFIAKISGPGLVTVQALSPAMLGRFVFSGFLFIHGSTESFRLRRPAVFALLWRAAGKNGPSCS